MHWLQYRSWHLRNDLSLAFCVGDHRKDFTQRALPDVLIGCVSKGSP